MLTSYVIVRRGEIPMITEIMEGGELHQLGELRDFRRHPLLKDFLPENGRLAIAWVRLGPNQVLAPHRHPTRTLLLVTSGCGVVLDRPEEKLVSGDAVLVPEGTTHGFMGLEPDGVDGLSIQFEERGLYEDTERPQVVFEDR